MTIAVNPFVEKNSTDTRDEELIEAALNGSRESLEQIIYRHQAWIYNIALRMVFYPQEAEDITQEVLIKIITKLSSFRKESSFRTWVYRIVVNQVLNMKKSLGEKNHASNFDEYWKIIDNVPDRDLPLQENYDVEMRTLVNEVKVSCMSGMLLCLDREQRLVYILGVIFQVTDKIGAEILDISKDSFGQKLSRARRQIFNFMNSKCGLMNKNNPCKCEKKTKVLIDCGYVNPKKLLFNINYIHSVESTSEEKTYRFDELLDERSQKLFRESPFQYPPDFVAALREVLNHKEFRDIFNFTN
jgi:RNA polymerase sigma factor (sigma-70 family)